MSRTFSPLPPQEDQIAVVALPLLVRGTKFHAAQVPCVYSGTSSSKIAQLAPDYVYPLQPDLHNAHDATAVRLLTPMFDPHSGAQPMESLSVGYLPRPAAKLAFPLLQTKAHVFAVSSWGCIARLRKHTVETGYPSVASQLEPELSVFRVSAKDVGQPTCQPVPKDCPDIFGGFLEAQPRLSDAWTMTLVVAVDRLMYNSIYVTMQSLFGCTALHRCKADRTFLYILSLLSLGPQTKDVSAAVQRYTHPLQQVPLHAHTRVSLLLAHLNQSVITVPSQTALYSFFLTVLYTNTSWSKLAEIVQVDTQSQCVPSQYVPPVTASVLPLFVFWRAQQFIQPQLPYFFTSEQQNLLHGFCRLPFTAQYIQCRILGHQDYVQPSYIFDNLVSSNATLSGWFLDSHRILQLPELQFSQHSTIECKKESIQSILVKGGYLHPGYISLSPREFVSTVVNLVPKYEQHRICKEFHLEKNAEDILNVQSNRKNLFGHVLLDTEQCAGKVRSLCGEQYTVSREWGDIVARVLAVFHKLLHEVRNNFTNNSNLEEEVEVDEIEEEVEEGTLPIDDVNKGVEDSLDDNIDENDDEDVALPSSMSYKPSSMHRIYDLLPHHTILPMIKARLPTFVLHTKMVSQTSKQDHYASRCTAQSTIIDVTSSKVDPDLSFFWLECKLHTMLHNMELLVAGTHTSVGSPVHVLGPQYINNTNSILTTIVQLPCKHTVYLQSGVYSSTPHILCPVCTDAAIMKQSKKNIAVLEALVTVESIYQHLHFPHVHTLVSPYQHVMTSVEQLVCGVINKVQPHAYILQRATEAVINLLSRAKEVTQTVFLLSQTQLASYRSNCKMSSKLYLQLIMVLQRTKEAEANNRKRSTAYAGVPDKGFDPNSPEPTKSRKKTVSDVLLCNCENQNAHTCVLPFYALFSRETVVFTESKGEAIFNLPNWLIDFVCFCLHYRGISDQTHAYQRQEHYTRALKYLSSQQTVQPFAQLYQLANAHSHTTKSTHTQQQYCESALYHVDPILVEGLVSIKQIILATCRDIRIAPSTRPILLPYYCNIQHSIVMQATVVQRVLMGRPITATTGVRSVFLPLIEESVVLPVSLRAGMHPWVGKKPIILEINQSDEHSRLMNTSNITNNNSNIEYMEHGTMELSNTTTTWTLTSIAPYNEHMKKCSVEQLVQGYFGSSSGGYWGSSHCEGRALRVLYRQLKVALLSLVGEDKQQHVDILLHCCDHRAGGLCVVCDQGKGASLSGQLQYGASLEKMDIPLFGCVFYQPVLLTEECNEQKRTVNAQRNVLFEYMIMAEALGPYTQAVMYYVLSSRMMSTSGQPDIWLLRGGITMPIELTKEVFGEYYMLPQQTMVSSPPAVIKKLVRNNNNSNSNNNSIEEDDLLTIKKRRVECDVIVTSSSPQLSTTSTTTSTTTTTSTNIQSTSTTTSSTSATSNSSIITTFSPEHQYARRILTSILTNDTAHNMEYFEFCKEARLDPKQLHDSFLHQSNPFEECNEDYFKVEGEEQKQQMEELSISTTATTMESKPLFSPMDETGNSNISIKDEDTPVVAKNIITTPAKTPVKASMNDLMQKMFRKNTSPPPKQASPIPPLRTIAEVDFTDDAEDVFRAVIVTKERNTNQPSIPITTPQKGKEEQVDSDTSDQEIIEMTLFPLSPPPKPPTPPMPFSPLKILYQIFSSQHINNSGSTNFPHLLNKLYDKSVYIQAVDTYNTYLESPITPTGGNFSATDSLWDLHHSALQSTSKPYPSLPQCVPGKYSFKCSGLDVYTTFDSDLETVKKVITYASALCEAHTSSIPMPITNDLLDQSNYVMVAEVKSPRDKLAMHQKLWFEILGQFIRTELVRVVEPSQWTAIFQGGHSTWGDYYSD